MERNNYGLWLSGRLQEIGRGDLVESHKPYLEIAVKGIAVVRRRYGSLSDGNLFPYSGKIDSTALPAYHSVEHTQHDVVDGVVSHAERVGMSDDDLVAAIVAAAWHDSVLGNGRKSNNPDGYDELLSAKEADRVLVEAGPDDTGMRHRVWAGIMATAFNESTLQQNVRPEMGNLSVQTAVAGADLIRAAQPHGVINNILWPVEAATRRSGGDSFLHDLMVRMVESGDSVNLESVLERVQDHTELRQRLVGAMRDNSGFHRKITYPAGFSLDNPEQRHANSDRGDELVRELAIGEISLVEAYRALSSETPWATGSN